MRVCAAHRRGSPTEDLSTQPGVPFAMFFRGFAVCWVALLAMALTSPATAEGCVLSWTGGLAGAWECVEDTTEKGKELIKDASDGVKDFIEGASDQWEGLKDYVNEKIIEPVENESQEFRDKAVQVFSDLDEGVKDLQDGLKKQVEVLDRQVYNWVGQLPEPAKSILGPLAGLVGQAAYGVIDSFWLDPTNPLNDLSDKMTSALSLASETVSAVRTAIDEVKKFTSEAIPIEFDCPGCQGTLASRSLELGLLSF